MAIGLHLRAWATCTPKHGFACSIVPFIELAYILLFLKHNYHFLITGERKKCLHASTIDSHGSSGSMVRDRRLNPGYGSGFLGLGHHSFAHEGGGSRSYQEKEKELHEQKSIGLLFLLMILANKLTQAQQVQVQLLWELH